MIEYTPPPHKITSLIGFDFGSSFSKVCFRETENIYDFVIKDNSKYIPSDLFYGNNELSLNQKENYKSIKYFKCDMILEQKYQFGYAKEIIGDNDSPFICSVFYIASMLKFSKQYIKNQYSNQNVSVNFEQITLGVPFDRYDRRTSKFEDIINFAYFLEEFIESNYCIKIQDLKDLYKKWAQRKYPLCHILPELYAESLSFLLDRNIQDGLYYLVDIGGGTVDCALLHKIRYEDKRIMVIEHSVDKIGNEVRQEEIKRNGEESVKERFEKQFETSIIESMKLGYNPKQYGSGLIDNLKNQGSTLPIIFLGGGWEVSWYRDIINGQENQIQENLNQTTANPYHQKIEDDLLQKEDKRLLVAKGLSTLWSRIPKCEWLDKEEYKNLLNINYNEKHYRMPYHYQDT